MKAKFEVTKENVMTVIHAFKHHPENAKGILKNQFGITDDEFLQVRSNYHFTQFSHLAQKKLG